MRTLSRIVTLLAVASAAGAQLPNPSPAAFGMAGNYTAIARGYEAVAWNPANLAQYGRPFLSVGFLPFGGTIGADPVGFNNINEWSGKVIDSTTRAAWVQLAEEAGRQRIRLDGGFTPVAFSLGPIGFQSGVSFYSNMDLGPGLWEALLFGNAGNHDGQAGTLDFTGTGVSSAMISTGALSFATGVPFRFTGGLLSNERLTIGITGKYVMGNALISAVSDSGGTDANGINMTMPMIMPDSNYNGSVGIGTGADLSLAWSAGPWRVGLLAENVFNSFKWDTTKLAFMSQSFYFDQDTSYSSGDDDELPYVNAPAPLRQRIAAQGFKPAINIGAALKVSNKLTITADLHQQSGGDDAISIGPTSRVGVGVEMRYVPFIPIRAGVASVTDGWQAAAGFGIRLIGYEIGVSGSIRRRGAANESGIMVGLVGIGH